MAHIDCTNSRIHGFFLYSLMRQILARFGLVLFSHQVGGFLGAYLGGIVVDKFGNYQYMWYADMALAALAAVLNLPIQEPKIMKATS